MSDLKIGCRYRWRHHKYPLILWALSSWECMEALVVPDRNNDLLRAFWVPRDELEPLND